MGAAPSAPPSADPGRRRPGAALRLDLRRFFRWSGVLILLVAAGLLAALLPLAAEVATDAIAAPLEEIGGLSFTADLASMAHETQTTRLYRS